MSKSYQITTMQLGPMDNFVYIITDLESKKSAVVDPAWDTHKIMQHVQQHNSQIDEILLTHSHHDHINGVDEIVNQYDCQLHLLKAEAEFWQTDLDKPRLHAGGDRIQLGSTRAIRRVRPAIYWMVTLSRVIPCLYLVVDAVIWRVVIPSKCIPP